MDIANNLEASSVLTNELEKFLLLAKSAEGDALLNLIKQVLEAPGIFVFGELIAMPNVAELQHGPNSKHWLTLNLFAYGSYKQYMKYSDEFLDLNEKMKLKLQYLSIASMGLEARIIPFSKLLEDLHVTSTHDLEDLIIKAIYANVIQGKLDESKQQLEIDFAIARDVRSRKFSLVTRVLKEFSDTCASVLSCTEKQIDRANTEKAEQTKRKEERQKQVDDITNALQNHSFDKESQDQKAHAVGEAVHKKSLRNSPKFGLNKQQPKQNN